MNWDDLKIILALHRTGSQTAAGQQLRLNQSTVARRLNAIEADLGIILFTRSKAGFVATEAGAVVLGIAGEMELRALRMHDAVGAYRGDTHGLVRIIANPWIIRQLVVPGMAEFCARHPEIAFQLIGDSRNRRTISQEPQLDIRFEMPVENSAISVELCRIPYALYGPAGAPPDELDWLTFWADESEYAPERWLKRREDPRGFLRVRANDASLVLAAIAGGLGKGLVPEIIAEHADGVARISGAGHEIVRPLHLLVHPDIIEIERVKIVMRWLRELFAGLFPEA